MLERLADYDDALMEELISDIEPPRDQVFDDLTRELRAGRVVPLLIGSAERGNGVTRLLKALRHETPGLVQTRGRLGVASDGPPLAHVMRTIHTAHGGKLSVARVLRGSFADAGTVVTASGEEDRIGGISRLMGVTTSKQPRAEEGDTVAFGRLDHVATGESLTDAKAGDLKGRAAAGNGAGALPKPTAPQPVHALALKVRDRKDEVRLASAMAKLAEEDPSLTFVQDQTSGEMKLFGQGEMHVRVALEKLAARFGVTVEAKKPSVSYCETIREATTIRGRHKKQSGGHGQFGDVVIDIKPRQRSEGFAFNETVHGGTVPRQYFSSVEAGCRDALTRGPLGFQVVDVAVTLTDGSYHTVDSSDMAFRAAAKIAMNDGLPKCKPVLLEPILAVSISTPNESLSRVTGIASSRRGQILGYDSRPGWEGWDTLEALIPEAEMGDLIVELRSATAGVGTYTSRFDHLAEIVGRPAEQIVSQAAQARAAASGH
jgi:elongation factor G